MNLKLTVRKKFRRPDFKKGYQPRRNIVQDDKGDLFRDSHFRHKTSFNILSNICSLWYTI